MKQYARLTGLIIESYMILMRAIREIKEDGKEVAGIVILFSGGNDSTTVAHLFRHMATHAAHANTGIGIEETREYVRRTCKKWNLPLIEKTPRKGETYDDLVLGRCLARTGPNKGNPVYAGGFPGPAMHWLMYQRLKERCMDQVRSEIVINPRKQRVIFIAGRRADESKRRKNRLGGKDPIERRGSIVWVSPLLNWTKQDLNDYRKRFPKVPRNEVSDMLHMSGECLCGAFAHPGELDEIEFFGYREAVEHIRSLERRLEILRSIRVLKNIEEKRCKWGWGAGKEKPSETGIMCTSCDARYQSS